MDMGSAVEIVTSVSELAQRVDWIGAPCSPASFYRAGGLECPLPGGCSLLSVVNNV